MHPACISLLAYHNGATERTVHSEGFSFQVGRARPALQICQSIKASKQTKNKHHTTVKKKPL